MWDALKELDHILEDQIAAIANAAVDDTSYEQIDRRPWVAVWRIARAICPIVYPSEVLIVVFATGPDRLT